MERTDEEWKKQLEPQQYRVLRKKATEPAFTGKYLHNKDKGVYVCGGCGAELFSSDAKYDSGSGWPSFWTTLAKDKIVEIPDHTLGMERIEIVCKNCGGHLGHLFDDGPQPTGMRYCVNSLSLGFKKKDMKRARTGDSRLGGQQPDARGLPIDPGSIQSQSSHRSAHV